MANPNSSEKSINDLMPAEPVSKTKRQQYFERQRMNWSDRDLQLEANFQNKLQLEKLERIRSNSSKIVWWLIAIPIILAVLFFILSILGVALAS